MGVEVNCKVCRSKYKKSIEGRTKNKLYKRKGKEYTMWQCAKRRAYNKGIEFNITKEDIIIPSHCPVLGIPISRDGNCKCMDNSPSLDRIDNSKGYIKGNICVISWRANSIKNVGSIDEHQKIIDYMKSFSRIIDRSPAYIPVKGNITGLHS